MEAPAGRHAAWTVGGPAEAPALVFVHGTRATRAQWRPQLDRLAARFRCIAVDLPGHGALADTPFTLGVAAASIADAVAAGTPAGRAVVVGHSLGGYAAMETALRHPGRVAGLVLAGCSADGVGAPGVVFRVAAAVFGRCSVRLLAGSNAAFYRARYGRRVADPIIAGGFWFRGGAGALRALVGRRFRDGLAALDVPVLVLNGAWDPLFRPGGASFAAAAGHGRHEVIPRASHLSNLDRPDAFAAAVARFADEVAAGASRGTSPSGASPGSRPPGTSGARGYTGRARFP